MAFLGNLLKKKQQQQQPLEVETSKSDLRIYLESLIDLAQKNDSGEKVSVMGMSLNPVVLLPMVSKQVSDAMLETIGDIVCQCADDIRKIRADRQQILTLEKGQNEIFGDFTQLQEN